MLKCILFDLARVILFPVDQNYAGELNSLHRELKTNGNYNFKEHFYLNTKLLNYLKSLYGKIDLDIFTSGKIQENSEINSKLIEVFNKIISAEDYGIRKNSPAIYERVLSELGHATDEVLFVDDNELNIEAAKLAGLNTYKFETTEKTLIFLQTLEAKNWTL